MTAHSTQVRVRFYELDPYGHVNHSVYIQYFETARVELLAELGFGLDEMQQQDVAFVVTRIATRFVRPAALLDELTIETGLVSAGRVRTQWAQRIVDAATGEVVVTQVIDFATTNQSGKPRRSPEGLAEAMAPYGLPDGWLGKHHPDQS